MEDISKTVFTNRFTNRPPYRKLREIIFKAAQVYAAFYILLSIRIMRRVK